MPLPSATNLSFRSDAVDKFTGIIAAIAERGWAVVDDFLPGEWVAELREEQQRQSLRGDFHCAATGRLDTLRQDAETRGDRILWLERHNAGPAQRQYLELLEELRLAVNHELFLGLFGQETHAAVYPPGRGYRRHLDGFRKGNLRTLTGILYLNPRWRKEDGGALRMFLDDAPGGDCLEVLPEAGRFVVFLSERFEHEVATTQRLRWSVTSWFSRRSAA
ncbi:MAG: 2OG-Fe(II) oxygenase [Gammaproteobacteria bacterium]|nr:2OG-Fe(II) oxygenase [Gammaproteobacteria bacterium]